MNGPPPNIFRHLAGAFHDGNLHLLLLQVKLFSLLHQVLLDSHKFLSLIRVVQKGIDQVYGVDHHKYVCQNAENSSHFGPVHVVAPIMHSDLVSVNIELS